MRSLSVLLVLSFAIACNKEITDPPVPETARVIASANNNFLPQAARIQRGGTITWEFQTVAHTVIFDSPNGAPPNIDQPLAATTEARTFATAGVYSYHCEDHPSMTGVITVVAP